MSNDHKEGLFERMGRAVQNLKKEMYANSVAAEGPTDAACCHKPVEELEAQREHYREVARRKREKAQSG